MSGGERVEDTRTLRLGDPVRVVIDSVVRDVSPTAFGVSLGADSRSPWWFVGHDGVRDNVQVYRLPKPLPPEPDKGAAMIDRHGREWRRGADGSWCRPWDGALSDDWAWLLANFGPVRLLGDPIEAPRWASRPRPPRSCG